MAHAQSMALPFELRSLLTGLESVRVADNQQWILELMRKQGRALITMLWRMLGSEEDVLDAYQTAVCQLASKGRRAIDASPGGYFYRIAVNAGIGILRSRKLRREQWPAIVERQTRRDTQRTETGVPGHAYDQRQVLDQMRRAIYELPPYLRNVIILRDLGELPYRQVATILNVTSGTARLYRRQAVVRLAEKIGQEANG